MGSRDTVTGHFPSFVCQAGTIQDLTRDTVPDGVVRGRNKPLTANTEPKIGSQAHGPPRKARVADIRRDLEPEWGVRPVWRTSDGTSSRNGAPRAGMGRLGDVERLGEVGRLGEGGRLGLVAWD
jgi:hypothetical protein